MKTILGGSFDSTGTIAPGNTYYCFPYMSRALAAASATVESENTFPSRLVGNLQSLRFYVVSNTLSTASTTVTLRINSTDTALTVTVPAGGTGWYEIESTVAVIATDTITIEFECAAGGTGTILLSVFQSLFEPTTSTNYVWRESVFGNPGITASSVTRYASLSPNANTGTTLSETNQYRLALYDTTASNYAVRAGANARSTSTVLRVRIAGGDGNQTNTVTASSTATFEDTTNTDALTSQTTVYNQRLTTGTGSGSFNWRLGGCLMTSEDGAWVSAGNTQAGVTRAASGTPTYYQPIGLLVADGLAASEMIAPFNLTIQKVTARVMTNTYSASCSITIYINGVASAATYNIASAATGQQGSYAFDLDVNEGDRIAIGVAGGTSGNIEFASMQIGYVETPAPPAGANADLLLLGVG